MELGNPGLGQLIELHDTLPKRIFQRRFIHGTNPFMPFFAIKDIIFDKYAEQFEVWDEDPIPLILTETGRSSGTAQHCTVMCSPRAQHNVELLTSDRMNF